MFAPRTLVRHDCRANSGLAVLADDPTQAKDALVMKSTDRTKKLAAMLAVMGGLTIATSGCSKEEAAAPDQAAASSAADATASCGAASCAAGSCAAADCAAKGCAAKPCAAKGCAAKPCAAKK